MWRLSSLSFISIALISLLLLLLSCCSWGAQLAHLDENGEHVYNSLFYSESVASAAFYPLLVELIQKVLPNMALPSSTVDVGCGLGLLVEAWRAAGVKDSYCLEGSDAAKEQWPSQYRDKYYRQVDLKEAVDIPKTELVTTFEVAEHLPPEKADHFVATLTTHRPSVVVFGAATINQDQGRNPTHINENTFAYWIDKFRNVGYEPHMESSVLLKHLILLNPEYQSVGMWWYPKNVLVFVNMDTWKQEDLDRAVISHPQQNSLFHPFYLNFYEGIEIHEIWKRDWTDFVTLYYEEQKKAFERMQGTN